MDISEEDLSYVEEALKQLQAENEELKKNLAGERLYSSQIEELEEGIHYYLVENKKLLKENEQLKKQLENIKGLYTHACKLNAQLLEEQNNNSFKKEINYGQGYKVIATEKGVFTE